jgi:hypothetical protein
LPLEVEEQAITDQVEEQEQSVAMVQVVLAQASVVMVGMNDHTQ